MVSPWVPSMHGIGRYQGNKLNRFSHFERAKDQNTIFWQMQVRREELSFALLTSSSLVSFVDTGLELACRSEYLGRGRGNVGSHVLHLPDLHPMTICGYRLRHVRHPELAKYAATIIIYLTWRMANSLETDSGFGMTRTSG